MPYIPKLTYTIKFIWYTLPPCTLVGLFTIGLLHHPCLFIQLNLFKVRSKVEACCYIFVCLIIKNLVINRHRNLESIIAKYTHSYNCGVYSLPYLFEITAKLVGQLAKNSSNSHETFASETADRSTRIAL